MKFVAHPVGQRYRVKLDISDVKMPEKEKLEPYLLFNGDTYKPIGQYAKEPQAFDNLYRGSNWLLAQIKDNDQKIMFVKFFASMNYQIKSKMPTLPKLEAVPNFARDLGSNYLELVKACNMLEIFREYARTQITLQDTSKFGTRPQDTKELTFSEPEMRELMVVALFCKFVSPIFGEMIANLPEQEDEDGKKKLPPFKETLCSSFLNPLLSEYFPDMINKLQNYISHIINGIYSKIVDQAAIHCGLTPNTRTSIVMSSLLVRNYVLCVLEVVDSNIARYTDTMVRTLVTTQDNTAHRSQVKSRQNYGAMSADESGNMAQMEIDSLVSAGTMDVTVIIEACIDRVIDTYRAQYEITLDEFHQCTKWFELHHIYPSPLNLMVACSVFGCEIGGGRGIEMIGAASYTKLIAMLQLIALKLGYFDLAKILTATKSATVKVESALTLEEENFKRQAPVLQAYRNCRECFAKSMILADDDKTTKPILEWDKQMSTILDDLTLNIYSTNIPPFLLDTEVNNNGNTVEDYVGRNGDVIVPSTKITEQACLLISIFNHIGSEQNF